MGKRPRWQQRYLGEVSLGLGAAFGGARLAAHSVISSLCLLATPFIGLTHFLYVCRLGGGAWGSVVAHDGSGCETAGVSDSPRTRRGPR